MMIPPTPSASRMPAPSGATCARKARRSRAASAGPCSRARPAPGEHRRILPLAPKAGLKNHRPRGPVLTVLFAATAIAGSRPMLSRLALLIRLWLAPGTGSLRANDHGASAVEILQPWAPAMSGQDPQLVYLTIRNRASVPDRLVRVLSPVATKVELHAAAPNEGEPKPVAALSIGTGQDLVLGPSGPHLAMVGLKRTLLENQTFRLALEFDGAGRILVDVVVGAPAPSHPQRH